MSYYSLEKVEKFGLEVGDKIKYKNEWYKIISVRSCRANLQGAFYRSCNVCPGYITTEIHNVKCFGCLDYFSFTDIEKAPNIIDTLIESLLDSI